MKWRAPFSNLSLLRKAHICLFGLFVVAAVLLAHNTYSKNRSLVSIIQQEIVVVHFLSAQIIEVFYHQCMEGLYTPEAAKAAALTALGSIDLLGRGYVTVVARDGTMLLHPTRRGAVVESIILEGEHVPLADAIKRVQGEGLLMLYKGRLGDKKMGRIAFFEPWEWLVTYGRYQDDINQILLKDIILDVVAGALFLAILAMILLHIRTAVIAPLGRCIHHINKIVGGAAGPVSQDELQTLNGFTDSIVSLTIALKETIRKTKKVEKTLKDNQQLLFEVLNKAAVGISIKDKHLNYLRVNNAFEQFVRGKDATDCDVAGSCPFPPAQSRLVAAEVKKLESYVQQYARPLVKEMLVHTTNNELSWLVSSFPIYDSHNEFYAVCTMATDISALKKNEKEIGAINAKLSKRTEELQNFIHVISHDLKSPLKNIGNCCQLLRAEYGDLLDETAGLYLSHAITNANKMVRLISELLTYSRMAKLTERKKEFESMQAVENASASAITLADQPKVKLVYSALPRIYANEVTIAQVFQNLIDNAVKHVLPVKGQVTIAIEACIVDGHWEFSVTDDGPGIAPQYAKLIFRIFQKLELRQSDYDSSGTGLAICKNIIAQHGGEMWLDKTYKGGARFKFTLPLCHSPSLDPLSENTEEAPEA